MQKICIDPGHGGYDPGCAGNGLREKDITLTIGLQLRDILQRAGFQIVMTRDGDYAPGHLEGNLNGELQERCRIANSADADFFLSIHVNAGGGRGAEIYTYRGENYPLASEIVKQVASVIGGYHGQPVKDGSSLAVIRGTRMTAALVEIGFIDSADATTIKTRLNDFSPAMAHAICYCYGVPYPEPAKPPKDELADAVEVLRQAGIINSPDYWLQNARPGKQVIGEYAATLILKTAKRLKGGE